MESYPALPELLHTELQKRRVRNERYSLRSFARALGLSPAFLSKVMNGKKSVGEATFQKIAIRLAIDPEQADLLKARLPGFKAPGLAFSPVEADQFRFISDWHYFAILEALTLEDGDPSPAWLARRLGISENRVELALDRLLRLGLLQKDARGQIVRRSKNHTTAHFPVPTA